MSRRIPGPTVSASIRARVASTSIHSSPSSTSRSIVEARALDHVARRSRGHHREVATGELVVVGRVVPVGGDLHVQRAADRERAVQVGERERAAAPPRCACTTCAPTRRRARRAGTAGPRGRRRRGQASGANARTCAAIAGAASNATTGEPSSPLCQPGPHPRSARTPGGTRATNASSAGGRARRRCSIQSSTLVSYTSTVVRSTVGKNGRRGASRTGPDRRRRPPRVRAARRRADARVDRALGRRARAPLLRGVAGRDDRAGRPSTCTSATSGSCPIDPTTRTRAWRGGSCSTRWRPARSTRWSRPGARRVRHAGARRVPADRHRPPRPRSRRPHRVAVSRHARRSTSASGSSSDRRRRAPASAADVHLSRDRARRLVVVTVEGEEKRDAIERIRAGEDLPGARIRARAGAVDRRPGGIGGRLRSPHAQRLVVPGAARRARWPS